MRCAILVLALAMGGCFGYVRPTENQKELHQQTIGAADFVEKTATDPQVKQAGADAKLTAITSQDTLIGKPETVKPYSHQEVVKIVEVVRKEYDESKAPWYKRWAGTLITGLGGLGTLLGVVGYFYPPAGIAARILSPIASKLMDMKQQTEGHASDLMTLDTLQTHITDLTKTPGVGPVLNELLKKVHLEQLVHSPEAPDLPPAPPSA